MSQPAAPRTRRRVPWWGWTLAGLAALTTVIALVGGFNDVAVEKLPQIQLGERFVGNEVALQVDDIYLSTTAPVTGYDAADGQVYVVVDATAENTTKEPNIFLGRTLRIIIEGAVDGNDEPYSVVELRTGELIQVLQPGLPMEVAFFWSVPESRVAEGDEIFLGIFERYDYVDDPRYDDSKTTPVPIVRLAETVGGFR